ncbi:hypothetical protein B7494_g5536 [Chlorociboria aeruginascens]|nr:hypothetical protein B7494_g5536 [Chlorociboria aeruginascens]
MRVAPLEIDRREDTMIRASPTRIGAREIHREILEILREIRHEAQSLLTSTLPVALPVALAPVASQATIDMILVAFAVSYVGEDVAEGAGLGLVMMIVQGNQIANLETGGMIDHHHSLEKTAVAIEENGEVVNLLEVEDLHLHPEAVPLRTAFAMLEIPPRPWKWIVVEENQEIYEMDLCRPFQHHQTHYRHFLTDTEGGVEVVEEDIMRTIIDHQVEVDRLNLAGLVDPGHLRRRLL